MAEDIKEEKQGVSGEGDSDDGWPMSDEARSISSSGNEGRASVARSQYISPLIAAGGKS